MALNQNAQHSRSHACGVIELQWCRTVNGRGFFGGRGGTHTCTHWPPAPSPNAGVSVQRPSVMHTKITELNAVFQIWCFNLPGDADGCQGYSDTVSGDVNPPEVHSRLFSFFQRTFPPLCDCSWCSVRLSRTLTLAPVGH